MLCNYKKRKILITVLVCFAVIIILICKPISSIYKEFGCNSRLKAMASYLNHYELQDYTKWYDLLMQEGYSADCFKCPYCKENGKIGTYVINKNYTSIWNAREDIVLVFEGNTGWNQYGDANDILPLHHGGCNILFSNGKIKFIKKEDFSNLVWEK